MPGTVLNTGKCREKKPADALAGVARRGVVPSSERSPVQFPGGHMSGLRACLCRGSPMFSLTSVLLSVSLSLPLPLKNKTKQKTMKILLGALGEQGPSEHRRVGHQEVEMPGPGPRAEVGPSQMEKSGRQCQGNGLHEVGWHEAQQGCVGWHTQGQ